MKKAKKATTLLLALSMVMMSGIFAFANGEAMPQENSTFVDEIETTVHTDDPNRPNESAQIEQNSVPDYVSTKVFLRYTNEVPENILQGFAVEGFGPAGTSSSPYFTVDIDLSKIETLCEQGLIRKYISGEYVYYSAQENLEQSVTKTDATTCWDNILQTMSETDRQKFIEYFGVSGVAGTPNFIGYVFKLETDGWHIDGILDVKPGYVTEFYLNDEIKKTDVASAAMPINTAKGNIEEMLGADSGTIKWNDNGMGGTYEKGDDIYQFTISEGDYSVSNENVQYAVKIQDAYYLARIYVVIEKTEPVTPPVEPAEPDPVIPPVIPEPVTPIDPQPLQPDDPIEEPDKPTVNPQPLPSDDPLIEDPERPTGMHRPLPPDEHLIDPTDVEKLADPDQPKTGDEAPLMALGGLFFAAAGALGVIYIRRKL